MVIPEERVIRFVANFLASALPTKHAEEDVLVEPQSAGGVQLLQLTNWGVMT